MVLKLKVYMRSSDLWVGSSDLAVELSFYADSTVLLLERRILTDLRSFSYEYNEVTLEPRINLFSVFGF